MDKFALSPQINNWKFRVFSFALLLTETLAKQECGNLTCYHGDCGETSFYWRGEECDTYLGELLGEVPFTAYHAATLALFIIVGISAGTLFVSIMCWGEKLARIQKFGVGLVCCACIGRIVFNVAVLAAPADYTLYFVHFQGFMFPTLVTIICIQVILWLEFCFSFNNPKRLGVQKFLNWKRIYIASGVICFLAFAIEFVKSSLWVSEIEEPLLDEMYNYYLAAVSLFLIIGFLVSRIMLHREIRSLRHEVTNIGSSRQFRMFTIFTVAMVTNLALVILLLLAMTIVNHGRNLEFYIPFEMTGRLLEFFLCFLFLGSVGASGYKRIFKLVAHTINMSFSRTASVSPPTTQSGSRSDSAGVSGSENVREEMEVEDD